MIYLIFIFACTITYVCTSYHYEKQISKIIVNLTREISKEPLEEDIWKDKKLTTSNGAEFMLPHPFHQSWGDKTRHLYEEESK